MRRPPVLLFLRCERSTGDPRDDGAWDPVSGEDADHTVMCCGRRPDGPPAESGVQERKASCTTDIDGVCSKGDKATRKSFILAPSSFRGAGWRWPMLSNGRLGVRQAGRRMPWTVGPPLLSSLSSAVSGEEGSGCCWRVVGPRFLQQGTSAPFEHLFALFCLPPRSRRSTSFERDSKVRPGCGATVGGDS